MFQRVLLDFVLKTFGLGAENETRTRDPNLGKVVLYQLSYFRICLRSRCSSPSLCQGWIILSSWGKVVLYQLSYFRNNFRTLLHLYRFCECKYKANIFTVQEISKKFTFLVRFSAKTALFAYYFSPKEVSLAPLTAELSNKSHRGRSQHHHIGAGTKKAVATAVGQPFSIRL